MEPIPTRQCSKCKVHKPLTAFGARSRDTPHGKKGEPTAKCLRCLEKEAEHRAVKKRSRPASADSSDDDVEADEAVPLSQFLPEMTDGIDEPNFRLKQRVDTSELLVDVSPVELHKLDLEYRVKRVATLLGEQSLLHWT